MRACEMFINNRGLLLGEFGYEPDPGQVEYTSEGIVFYHYTWPENLDKIFAAGSGLEARLSVPTLDLIPQFAGCYLVEGFLEPLPKWLANSPYFGDLGMQMMREYVGGVLLRIEVPVGFPQLYVSDYAHVLECKHLSRRGRPALGLGYDCSTGHESVLAEVNSYIPITDYHGGHVAPNVKAVREGEGVVIPREYISIGKKPLLCTG